MCQSENYSLNQSFGNNFSRNSLSNRNHLTHRLPLAVAIVVHFSMRFCGINAIMYYSTALFKHANLGSVGPYATIGVGVILVLITLVSGSLMDRAGRRTLHLFGLFGTWLCSLLLTITFVFTVSIHANAC